DPDDRMNPNMPVQLFMNDPPPTRKRSRSRSRTPVRTNDHAINDELLLLHSPDREWMFDKDKKRKRPDTRLDGRFSRIPELVICNRRKRNLASSTCDLITHFLRTVANIVVHRFSNYGRDDPTAFVDKQFQLRYPYKFCTIPEVREYIDSAMYDIRDELRPQKIKGLCFAIVNDLGESLLEVKVRVFQSAKFWNRRIRGANPRPIAELRPQLTKALFELQQMPIKERILKELRRTETRFVIRYSAVEGKSGEYEEDDHPVDWERAFPTPLDWAVLHPWSDPIRNEFNQLQFHVMTES
ncbi:hypothetical protein PFISCL1PPCAC_18300, partial [Pristionchus fissidentatus]